MDTHNPISSFAEQQYDAIRALGLASGTGKCLQPCCERTELGMVSGAAPRATGLLPKNRSVW